MNKSKSTVILSTGLLLGIAAGAAFAQNQPTAGSTAKSVSNYLSDSDLTAKVKSALLTEKNLHSLDISVESTAGIVTLSGAVVSTAQIDQAVDVVRHVKGVKDVHNGLTLKTDGR